MLLDAAKSSLLVVDMQERLLPAMAESARVLAKTKTLLTAALELGLPVAMSEQYPNGLGPTVPELQSNESKVFEKLTFSCWRDHTVRQHFIELHEGGRPQVIVAGIEAHVCVLQTAADMAHAGFGVYVVTDAVSSRAPESVNLAMQRLAHDGVEVVNTEMVIFDLLAKAGTPQFKSLSALIK
jgi:nicotinamidase-related amidase